MWALLPLDIPVKDLVGRSVIARTTGDAGREPGLVIARFRRGGDDVVVRWNDPEAQGVRVAKDASLRAALLAVTGAGIDRAAIARVRWSWLSRRGLIGILVGCLFLLAFILRGMPDFAWYWEAVLVAGAVVVVACSVIDDRWDPPPARVLDGKRILDDRAVLRRLGMAPAGPTPADRVAVVKDAYGALLGDIVYRIENAALFDAAVPQTQRFQVALVSWDASAPDAASLADEVEDAFADARRHAEEVGLRHLPETARDPARRARLAAATALATDSEGERLAAAKRAGDLLASLALYYLPTVDPAAPSLMGARRELTR